jgi:GT2 family glycosyltransferase
MLRQHFPQVRFIQSDKNHGFAKANNAAFAVSLGRCLLFLNPDTELVSPAINAMYNCLLRLPIAGAVGSKLLNANRTVQTSCIKSFPTILNQFLDSEFLRMLWPNSSLWGMAALFSTEKEPQQVEALSGACVMLKRDVFERVGLFSEEYFMYAEDVDLCYKIWKEGYKNYYMPRAIVIHFGGGSTQKASSDFSEIMIRESNERFLRKARGKLYSLGYRGSTLICALARISILIIFSPWRIIRSGSESWWVSLRKWRGIMTWSLGFENRVKDYPGHR